MAAVQHSDAGSQSCKYKEQRKQQNEAYILNLIGNLRAERDAGGHDHSCQESTKKGMYTDHFADIGRGQYHGKYKCQQGSFEPPAVGVFQFFQQRPEHPPHEGSIASRDAHRVQRT